jgi:hypothetical protein
MARCGVSAPGPVRPRGGRPRARSRVSTGLCTTAVRPGSSAPPGSPSPSSDGWLRVAQTGTVRSTAAAAERGTSSPAAAGDADVTPLPGDTNADLADPAAPEGLTVTAVRAAHHEGYDRVVFELSGSGTPGWSVEYVETPSDQGSGEAVDVPGSAFQVTLKGTSGAEELARGPVAVSGTDVVEGVFYDATFEGTSVAWLGTSDRSPSGSTP